VWEVEYTDEFEEWWTRLEELDQEKLVAAVDKFRSLGRRCLGRWRIRWRGLGIPT
jgi:hypothetical protein